MALPILAAGGFWSAGKIFFISIVGSVISRILVALGVAFYTKKFVADQINFYLDKASNAIVSGDYAPFLAMLKADECLSILTAAISFRASMKALEIMFIKK